IPRPPPSTPFPYTTLFRSVDHGNRARLLAANAAAEQYFRAQLAEPAAQPARDFLGGRGFDQAAAERFGVGYAPKSFDALKNALRSEEHTSELQSRENLLCR